MANTLSKSGISNSSTIQAWHVSQSVDAFTGLAAYDIKISGSLTVSGALNLHNNNESLQLVVEPGSTVLALSSSTGQTTRLKSDTIMVGTSVPGATIYISGTFGQGLAVTASGIYSHAEGYLTIASGGMSHAEGSGSQAIGIYSHAEGERTRAEGESSHAEGFLTLASGENSHTSCCLSL